jgi:hypothetical protein
LVVLFAPAAAAEDAPAIYQSAPNFYNAVAGPGFAVTWAATPTDVTVDGGVTLTLTIAGVANPHRVRRPDLGSFPTFKARFRQITNGPDGSDTNRVTFAYRLYPREAGETAVPEIPFGYYSPASQKLATKYLDEIPLKVRPREMSAAAPVPLEAPERFFQIPSEDDLLKPRPAPPDWRHWLGLVAALSVIGVVWVAVWKRAYPDGTRLAALRRNRAVRRALDGLASAGRSADPPARAAAVLRNYLVERFGLPAGPAVPSDVEAAMRAGNVPEERVVAVVELLRKCDAARFGGPTDGGMSVVGQARELVLRWEGLA